MREGLWKVIQSEKGAPGSNASEADLRCYEEMKERALATIQLWIEEDLQGGYGDYKYCSDPAALWARITVDQKEVKVLDKNYLRKQLFEVSLELSGMVAKYLASFDVIIDKLRTCDVTITNGEKWFTIINSLPVAWSTFILITKGVIANGDIPKLIVRMKEEEAKPRQEKGLGLHVALFAIAHSRHIGVKYYRVRELVEDRSQVDMQYCATGDIVVDGLTKAPDRIKQEAFVRMCGLVY